jgi:hypothetical protein
MYRLTALTKASNSRRIRYRKGCMEKQTLAMLGRWRPVRSVVVAICSLAFWVSCHTLPSYSTKLKWRRHWNKLYNQSVWPV